MKLSDKKLLLYGLIRGCPMNQPLPNCPFKEYRNLPIMQQYNLVETVEIDFLMDSLNLHQACIEKRIVKNFA